MIIIEVACYVPTRTFTSIVQFASLRINFGRIITSLRIPTPANLAKDLSPRQRFFTPVLVRGEEAEGVRVWGFGKEAYTALLQLVLNEEYGDITDVVDGN